jgi:thiol-disulfide isomerase/thioredoxin
MSRPPLFVEESFSAALERSKAEGKLLVLDATASWCGPCKTMDRVTWSNPQVAAWFAERAIAVQIDVEQEEALAKGFRIQAMPTVIAFRNGEEFDRSIGLKQADELISWLEAVLRGETTLGHLQKETAATPHNMKARYDLASALANGGKLDEATDEFAWLWEHMLEHEPAMVGVRSSFMANEIQQLAASHRPARDRFAAMRDAIAPGPSSTAVEPRTISDWMVLNEVLGEQDRSVAWFDETSLEVRRSPKLLRVIELKVVPLLLARKRWADVGALYPDPIATLRGKHAHLEEMKSAPLPDEMKQQIVAYAEQSFREEAGTLHACLAAASRHAEAQAVAEEALRLAPGEAMVAALAQSPE